MSLREVNVQEINSGSNACETNFKHFERVRLLKNSLNFSKNTYHNNSNIDEIDLISGFLDERYYFWCRRWQWYR